MVEKIAEIRERLRLEKFNLAIKKRRVYPQWFIDELAHEHDRERSVTGSLGGKDKVEFVCPAGHVYKQQVRLHINIKSGTRGQGCPRCAAVARNLIKSRIDKEKRIYPQWFIDELYNNTDKDRAIAQDLQSTETVEFICTAGHVYTQTVWNHIRLSDMSRKYGCPVCGQVKTTTAIQQYKQEQRDSYPQWFIDEILHTVDKDRARAKTLTTNDIVMFQCNNGHIYEQLVHLHIKKDGTHGCGCPQCSNNRSITELEIEEYVISLGYKTEHHMFHSTIMTNFGIDIYIPEKNIGIEYNSIYYHKTLPAGIYSKPQAYHHNKFLACKELDIRLISVFEQDYRQDKGLILDFLKNSLCQERVIYARKTSIKSCTKEEKKEFIEQYHMSGDSTQGTLSYGLCMSGELLACMTFGKLRGQHPLKDKVGHYELVRFVTKAGVQIVGGASKLYTAFLREYDPQYVLCYSDNTFFSGDCYKHLGFNLVSTGAKSLNYQWVNNKECLERQQCMVYKLLEKYSQYKDENISGSKENYIMEDLGYSKVYRCGNTKWEYQKL